MVDKKLTRDQASNQMSSADKRIKGISSIADNTIRRSKIELKKQYGTDYGNRQAISSVDKALNSLSATTEALAKGVKTITVETARGVKNITMSGAKAMNEYAKAISEDIHINRQNFMVTTIGKFTPLVGYAVAKMMETTVFRNMIDKMKIGLGKALDSVTSRFKRLASMGWDKSKDFWNSMLDRISGKRGAVRAKMSNARQAKKNKKYFTKESAIKDALSDARVQAAAKKASKKNDIESQVPHMASGGYVQKEGLVKVHAAEVVQPVDKIVETIVDTVNKRLDQKDKNQKKSMFEGSMFEKGKKQDFFGFDKIGKSFRSGMEIMFRKNLALESRVMKRDKTNQKSLIGSFMTAYSEEAKQEELPLMERQVRAILELKSTISGQQKIRQAAWEKMLYEHPVFHGFTIFVKGLSKLTLSPMKFLLKKRGKYSNQLANNGTVFERLVDSSSQTFQGLMTKMDDVIANTYSIAGSTNSIAIKQGAQGAKEPSGTRKAPGQSGYRIAGAIGRLAYKGLVKYPAKAMSWMVKKSLGDNLNKELFDKFTKQRKWFGSKEEGDKGELRKQWDKKGSYFKSARKWTNLATGGERGGGRDVKDVWSGIKEKFRHQPTDAENFQSMSDALDKIRQEKKWKEENDIRNKKFRDEKRNREFSSGGKDRSGKKTEKGFLEKLVGLGKIQVKKATISNTIAKNNSSILKKAQGWMWTALKWIGGFAIGLPGKIGGWLSVGLTALFGGTFLSKIKGMFGGGSKVVSKTAGETAKKSGLLVKGSKYLAKTKMGEKVIASSLGKGVAKLGAKVGAKTAMKGIAKAIPGIGLLLGVGLGLRRALKGDYVGAAMEVASGALSATGVGIAGTIALEAGLVVRDNMTKSTKTKKVENIIKKQTTKISKTSISNALGSSINAGTKMNDRNKYEDKVNGLQAGIVNWMPLVNQFAGNTTVGTIASMWVRDKSLKNPTLLLDSLDKISKISKKEWIAAGGDAKVHAFATKLKGNKNTFLKKIGESSTTTSKFIKNKINYAKKIATDKAKEFKDSETGKDLGSFTETTKKALSVIPKTWDQTIKEGGTKKQAFKNIIQNKDAVMANVGTAFDKYVKSSTGQKVLTMMNTKLADSHEARMYWNSLSGEEKITQLKLLANTTASNMGIKLDKINAKYGITDKATTFGKAAKSKINDLKTNLPLMLMTMGDSIVTSLLKIGQFFTNAYGDPKQFYIDTKEKLFGGITKVREHSTAIYGKLHDLYILQKDQFDFYLHKDDLQYEVAPSQPAAKISAAGGSMIKMKGSNGKATTVELTAHKDEVVSVLTPELQRELMGLGPQERTMSGFNRTDVAMMGAREKMMTAALQNDMIGELKGVKNSVDTGSKANIANMQYTINQSSNISSNTSGSNGSNQMVASKSKFDRYTGYILEGNIA